MDPGNFLRGFPLYRTLIMGRDGVQTPPVFSRLASFISDQLEIPDPAPVSSSDKWARIPVFRLATVQLGPELYIQLLSEFHKLYTTWTRAVYTTRDLVSQGFISFYKVS